MPRSGVRAGVRTGFQGLAVVRAQTGRGQGRPWQGWFMDRSLPGRNETLMPYIERAIAVWCHLAFQVSVVSFRTGPAKP
ncbi:hypothetical protein GCM10009642_30470 [Nocardiopsis metallicus]